MNESERQPAQSEPHEGRQDVTNGAYEGRLTPEQLKLFWDALVAAGQHQAVEALRGHIASLEDEITDVYQYYEEFLIPQMEGRRIGQSTGLSRQTGRSR